MDEADKDFADELIRVFGEDRFYHSCKRTMDSFSAYKLHMSLNGCIAEQSLIPLGRIGISYEFPSKQNRDLNDRETMCRITYGLTRYFKEFALKTHRPPDGIHARMILGETNEWVRMYSKLLETFPDWN